MFEKKRITMSSDGRVLGMKQKEWHRVGMERALFINGKKIGKEMMEQIQNGLGLGWNNFVREISPQKIVCQSDFN